MNVKSCCFTGHRPKALPWNRDESDVRCTALKSKLRYTLESLIVEQGYEKFISGMAQGADMICAEVVLALKNVYPHIKLECAIPNRAFTSRWILEDVRRYSSILTRADYINFINDEKSYSEYSKNDLMLRNIYMVDNSDVVIAVYKEGESGGTKNTIDYAEYRNKTVIIISPE